MKKSVKAGVLGGIIGGIVFGMIMQMMGMIPMIAMMVGSSSLFVGWILHMIISVIFGAVFGLLTTMTNRIFVLSIVYGIIIWIVGPLVIMPLMLGMGTNLVNAFAPDQLMSLGTHIFFSLILAISFKLLTPKTSEQKVSA